MNGKKILLLAAIAAATCAFGLAACETQPEETPHSHNWGSWTVEEQNKPTLSASGKATRTCTGEGKCGAGADKKEYALPNLSSEDYTVTGDTATCSAGGTANYSYDKDGVSVSFAAVTPINAENHSYAEKWTSDGAQHWHAADCIHKLIGNEFNRTQLENHVYCEDGYCTVCYTVALHSTDNQIKFVAGGGIEFTAFVYTSGAANYTFKYDGDSPITVKYGSYATGSGATVYQTVNLVDGGSFTVSVPERGTGEIYITSDGEKITGTLKRDAELLENADGYPVKALKEGEPYVFTGGGSGKFQYVMDADNEDAEIYTDIDGVREKLTLPYKFRLGGGEKQVFYMSYAGENKITYNVSVSREYDSGTEQNPVSLSAGVQNSVTVPSGEQVYCSFVPAENGWYKISSQSAGAILIAGASSSTVGATDEVHGGQGQGFDFRFKVSDFTIYENSGYSFRISSLGGEELTCNFTAEKTADPAELTLGAPSTGNDFYKFTAGDSGTDYLITVSALPESGYFTAIYEKQGIRTVENSTSTTLSISPDASKDVVIIYGNTAGSVTVAEDDSSLYLSFGVSAKHPENSTRYFRVPFDGEYTFTTSVSQNAITTRNYFWQVNGQTYQTQTVTLSLSESDLVSVKFISSGSATTVTILPVENSQLTIGEDTEVTVNKNAYKLLYFTGKANISYALALTGEGVQFVGSGTSKNITTDANGNVCALIEYTGGEESVNASVNVEQIPYALQLDTVYNSANGNALIANVVYTFTATEAGNYIISGLNMKNAKHSITVNGDTHIFTDASTSNVITEYTVENVQAGETVTFSLSYITSTNVNISLATAD